MKKKITEQVIIVCKGDETNRLLILKDLFHAIPSKFFKEIEAERGSFISKKKTIAAKNFTINFSITTE